MAHVEKEVSCEIQPTLCSLSTLNLQTAIILTLENADGAVAFPGPITFSGTLSGTTGVMTTTDDHTAALATNGATKKLYATEARGIARLAKAKVTQVTDASGLAVNNTAWL